MTIETGLKIENIRRRYLPELNLNAKATYQSDVPEIGFDIPNFASIDIPKAPKDQYGISLDVNQLIYDGGRGKTHEKLEESGLSVQIQLLEVEIYTLKSRVNDVYFTILAIEKNQSLLENKKEELIAKLRSISSAVKNGVMLKSNENLLHAEILTIDQKLIELESAMDGACAVLTELTGMEIDQNSDFKVPNVEISRSENNLRPEYMLFDLQDNQIENGKLLAEKNRMPFIGGFGQFGYGNPGLNMLNDKFDTYFIVGAKLLWNIYDWKKNKREIKSYKIKKEMLDNQRKTFSLNQKSILKSEIATVNKYEEMLKLDDEIINQRFLIKKSASSQLEQGVITSAEFIRFLNAEIQARINKEFHRIQLLQAKINYNNTYGD
jgi:outer membrane protein TolC